MFLSRGFKVSRNQDDEITYISILLHDVIIVSVKRQVYLLEGLVPTPFVAFGVPFLGCAGRYTVVALVIYRHIHLSIEHIKK